MGEWTYSETGDPNGGPSWSVDADSTLRALEQVQKFAARIGDTFYYEILAHVSVGFDGNFEVGVSQFDVADVEQATLVDVIPNASLIQGAWATYKGKIQIVSSSIRKVSPTFRINTDATTGTVVVGQYRVAPTQRAATVGAPPGTPVGSTDADQIETYAIEGHELTQDSVVQLHPSSIPDDSVELGKHLQDGAGNTVMPVGALNRYTANNNLVRDYNFDDPENLIWLTSGFVWTETGGRAGQPGMVATRAANSSETLKTELEKDALIPAQYGDVYAVTVEVWHDATNARSVTVGFELYDSNLSLLGTSSSLDLSVPQSSWHPVVITRAINNVPAAESMAYVRPFVTFNFGTTIDSPVGTQARINQISVQKIGTADQLNYYPTLNKAGIGPGSSIGSVGVYADADDGSGQELAADFRTSASQVIATINPDREDLEALVRLLGGSGSNFLDVSVDAENTHSKLRSRNEARFETVLGDFMFSPAGFSDHKITVSGIELNSANEARETLVRLYSGTAPGTRGDLARTIAGNLQLKNIGAPTDIVSTTDEVRAYPKNGASDGIFEVRGGEIHVNAGEGDWAASIKLSHGSSSHFQIFQWTNDWTYYDNSIANGRHIFRNNGGLTQQLSLGTSSAIWGSSGTFAHQTPASTSMALRPGTGGILYLGANNLDHWYVASANGNLRPVTDNAVSIGSPSGRMTAVYAVNGTIQTSDAREKVNVNTINPELAFRICRELRPVFYGWASECLDPSGKTHLGLIAQQAADAFLAVGLEPMNYGCFYWDPESDRWGLNYAQFIPLILAADRFRDQLLDVDTLYDNWKAGQAGA